MRERWFGATGRRVPEIALEGELELGDALVLDSVDDRALRSAHEAGRPVETSLTARTVSLDLEQLSGRRIVALAGGASKIGAMRSVLKSGYLTGLITDERSAKALMDDGTP